MKGIRRVLPIFCDKNSLFENGVRENLSLCAVTCCIPIYSRAGFHTSIKLRQPITVVQITDNGRIVKNAFFSIQAEMLEFWV